MDFCWCFQSQRAPLLAAVKGLDSVSRSPTQRLDPSLYNVFLYVRGGQIALLADPQ